jgi:hypothetical protein
MTYRKLLKDLSVAKPSQLDQDVTVYIRAMDEFFPAIVLSETGNSHEAGDRDVAVGVLDDDHLYLEVDG